MPCSDERPGDRAHDQHMRDGAALLCAIMKNELSPHSFSVQAWWQEHQRYDRNMEAFGSWEKSGHASK